MSATPTIDLERWRAAAPAPEIDLGGVAGHFGETATVAVSRG